jgi:hypothetical protein
LCARLQGYLKDMAEGKECAHEVSLLEIAADGSKRACGEGLLYDADGRSAGRALALEARVQLPGVASMAQVALNAEAEHLTLTLTVDEAPQSTHVIHLPAQCDPDQVGAKWSKKLKTLTVTLPLLGSQGPDAVRRLNAMHERAVLQDKNSNGASSPGTTVEQLAAKLAAANAAAAAAQQLAPLTAEQLAAKLAATNAAAAAKQQLAAETATGRLKALMQVAGVAAAGGQASVADLEALKDKVAAAAAASDAPLASQTVTEVAALQERLAKAVEAAGGSGPTCATRVSKALENVLAAEKAKAAGVASARSVAAENGVAKVAEAVEQVQAAVRGGNGRGGGGSGGGGTDVTTATELASKLASLEKTAKLQVEAAKAAAKAEEARVGARRAEIEAELAARELAQKAAMEEQKKRADALVAAAALQVERARQEEHAKCGRKVAAEPTKLVSGVVLVQKCERLLEAAALAQTTGREKVYSTEVVNLQIGDLYPPQASLCRQLMLQCSY